MIEILNKAKQKYYECGDKYFIDKCILAKGIYIRINKDLSIKDTDVLKIESMKSEDYPEELYDWFRERDFYSKIIYDDSNKCIDANEKKIHSITPFTLFLKRKNMPDMASSLSKNNMRRIDITGMSSEQIFNIVVEKHFEAMIGLYGDAYDDFNYEHYQ